MEAEGRSLILEIIEHKHTCKLSGWTGTRKLRSKRIHSLYIYIYTIQFARLLIECSIVEPER